MEGVVLLAGLGHGVWGGHGMSGLRGLLWLGLRKGLTMVEGEIKIWVNHDNLGVLHFSLCLLGGAPSFIDG
jgi:hypothetical protein